jgi:hypothetical protein
VFSSRSKSVSGLAHQTNFARQRSSRSQTNLEEVRANGRRGRYESTELGAPRTMDSNEDADDRVPRHPS